MCLHGLLRHAEVLFREGESTTFEVLFAPERSGEFAGRVVVASNDPATPETVVRVEGTGVAAAIQADPAGPIDLGSVGVGCETRIPVSLHNVGTEDLLVTDVSVVPGERAPALILSTPPLPALLEPTRWDTAPFDLEVSLVPQTLGEFTAVLEVSSDDPFLPVLDVEIVGMAVYDPECDGAG